MNDTSLAHAGIGFCMKEVASGEVVNQYNAQQSLVPASVMKLVTTYAAMKMLGEDYRFYTRLGYVGKIDTAGILRGDIIIIGGGDPTLGSGRMPGTAAEELMKEWVKSIKKAGIKQVDGFIETDSKRYDEDELARDWLLEDIGNYYGALPSGLNFAENLYKIVLKPGTKVGDSVGLIGTQPHILHSDDFINRLSTGPAGSGDDAYVIPDGGLRILEGAVPLGKETFTIKGADPNPAATCNHALQDALKASDISVVPPGTNGWYSEHGPPVSDTAILNVFQSPTLAEIVAQTNRNSINLYAETLLREMGYKYSGGKPGTIENGVKAVTDIPKKDGIDTRGLIMKDGCGLSPSDAVTAALLADVLRKEYSNKAFYNSLPIAGQSGAMKNMGKGTFIEGNMRAKTGHMEHVRSYAGYVKGKDGKMYSFALLVNNYTCTSSEIKAKIEKLLVGLGE